MMQTNYRLASLLVLVLLLSFWAGYFLRRQPLEVLQDPDTVLSVDSLCRLDKAPCSRTIGESATLRFEITPRPILGASPLTFRIVVDGIDIQGIALQLTGVSMKMGRYRYELRQVAGGEYLAEGSLPVCIRNQMQWQADIWLKTPENGLIKAPYFFTAYKQ